MSNKTRFSLLALSLSLTAFAGFRMYNLPLWSWWTLLLLTSAWSSWIFAALPLYTKHEKGLRWLGLSTLSGVFLTLGFPVIDFSVLLFLAFVPLLIVIDEVLDSDISIKKRMIMRYTYHAFVLWNILATFWVGNAGLIPGLIANFLNAFFMCLPILAYAIVRKRLSENLSYVALIGYWFAWEYLHLNWDLSWTWLTLGNAFANHPSWIQWYEFTGVFGGGLWIFAINILIFKILKRNHFSLKNIFLPYKKTWLAVSLIFLLPIAFSKIFRLDLLEIKPPMANVVALQPNYEPHYEKFQVPDDAQLERFLQLARKNIDSNTDYLILPETSFGYFDVERLDSYPSVQAFKALADSFPNLHIVAGFDMMKNYAPSPNLPSSVRVRGNRCYEIYNAATQIAHNQKEYPIYKKSKFVPGAETLPFSFLFGGLKDLFKSFGGTTEGLGGQPERSVFWNENGHAIAPVICYESIYGEYCGDYVRHGAQALFIMTNDGWWDDTPGYKQHLAFARLRAIELRKAVVRSANTGSCAFINKFGEVISTTKYNEPTALVGQIELNSRVTFYAKYGDYIAKTMIFVGFLLGIYSLFRQHI